MVLHHAASSTPSLLREAARIARRWIVLLEDCDVTGTADYKIATATMKRLHAHDPKGIFRTVPAWIALLNDCPGFALRDWGRIRSLSKHQIDYQRFFLAERTIAGHSVRAIEFLGSTPTTELKI